MAGDWIKVEAVTPDKSEVFSIADELDIDPDAAFGKLMRVWMWFDQHSENGHATSVTKKVLDRVVAVTGFCNAMINNNWMQEDENGIHLPNFDRHNGETAKKRGLEAKRKQKQRQKSQISHAESGTDGHAEGGTSAGPEKRREELHTYTHATEIIERLKQSGINERDFLKTKPRQIIDQWLKIKITVTDLDKSITRALEAMPENLCTAYLNPIVLQEVNNRLNPQEVNDRGKNQPAHSKHETALDRTQRQVEEYMRQLDEEFSEGDGAVVAGTG